MPSPISLGAAMADTYKVQITMSKRNEESLSFSRHLSQELQREIRKRIREGWMVTIYRLD